MTTLRSVICSANGAVTMRTKAVKMTSDITRGFSSAKKSACRAYDTWSLPSYTPTLFWDKRRICGFFQLFLVVRPRDGRGALRFLKRAAGPLYLDLRQLFPLSGTAEGEAVPFQASWTLPHGLAQARRCSLLGERVEDGGRGRTSVRWRRGR